MADKLDKKVEEVFPPGVKKSLESIAKKEGYVTYTISKRKADSEGQGYIGLTYAVDIKGKTPEGDKETNIFVKQAVVSEHMEAFTHVKMFYVTESYFYTELAKIYAQLQEDAKIPIEDRFNIIKGYEESNLEATFMENISERGFWTCDRMDIVSLNFLEKSIQQLARFHGLSYVLKKKRPQYFKEKLAIRINPLKLNDAWMDIITNTCHITCQDLTPETKKRAEAFIPTAVKKYKFYMKDHTPYSCLCHGDYRLMNIMKKEENGEVTEILPIDYQNFFYACPFIDFFYLVHGCTDREMRKNHLNHLKDLYYESLDAFLKYFDMTAEDVFPRSAYEETFKNKLDLGLIYSMVFYPFFFAPADNAPDWSKDSLATIKYTLDLNIQKRIQEMVDEYIELGIL